MPSSPKGKTKTNAKVAPFQTPKPRSPKTRSMAQKKPQVVTPSDVVTQSTTTQTQSQPQRTHKMTLRSSKR
jgi:hypothetical protein